MTSSVKIDITIWIQSWYLSACAVVSEQNIKCVITVKTIRPHQIDSLVFDFDFENKERASENCIFVQNFFQYYRCYAHCFYALLLGVFYIWISGFELKFNNENTLFLSFNLVQFSFTQGMSLFWTQGGISGMNLVHVCRWISSYPPYKCLLEYVKSIPINV